MLSLRKLFDKIMRKSFDSPVEESGHAENTNSAASLKEKNKYGLSQEVIETYKKEYPELASAPEWLALRTIAEVEHMKVCSHKNSYCGDDLKCRECPFWKHGIKVQSGR